MKTALLKIVCVAVLLTGCKPIQTVIPDPTAPHQVSRRTKVRAWLRKPGGEKQEVMLEVPAGWWLLPPQWAK